MTKVLIAIAHRPGPGDALRRQVLGLRDLFAGRWLAIDQDRGLVGGGPPFPAELRIVVCTAGGPAPDLPSGSFEHRPQDCPPEHLGFACHRVLSEADGAWDFHGFLEDGLLIEDTAFFAKLAALNPRLDRVAGCERPPILLPRRFETSLDPDRPASRLYPDHAASRTQVAGPRLFVPYFPINVTLEPSSFPHSGCFFLTREQLRVVARHPAWGAPVFDPGTPLDCAATRAVAESLLVYMPTIDSPPFLEVRRGRASVLERLRLSGGGVLWDGGVPDQDDLLAVFDRFLCRGDVDSACDLIGGLPSVVALSTFAARHMERRIAAHGPRAALGVVGPLLAGDPQAPRLRVFAIMAAQALERHGATEMAGAVLAELASIDPEGDPRKVIAECADLLLLSGELGLAAGISALAKHFDDDNLWLAAAELHLADDQPGRCLEFLSRTGKGLRHDALRGLALLRAGERDAARRWLEECEPSCEAMAARALIDLEEGRVEAAGEGLLRSLRADIPMAWGHVNIGRDNVFVAACRAYVERAFEDPHGVRALRFYRTILDERPEHWPTYGIWTLYARCLGPAAPPGRFPDILLNNRGPKGGSAVQPILFDALAPLGYSFGPMSDKAVDMAASAGTDGPVARWGHVPPDDLALPPSRRRLVVQVIRDPRDVLMSLWGRAHPQGFDDVPVDALRFAGAVEAEGDKWAVNNPDVLVVRVEDVRQDPERELRRILDRAGIALDDEAVRLAASGKSMADYVVRRRARMGQATDAQALGGTAWRKGQTGEWRDARPELKRLMREILGNALEALGYEGGDDWHL